MYQEDDVRADERRRIARHMNTIAMDLLRDPTSDAIDGYTAAVILDLADTIAKFEVPPHPTDRHPNGTGDSDSSGGADGRA